MKVILKEEVDNVGLPGDVVDVANGYGRNFLLPRGLAIKATPGALKEAETLTRARKARESKTLGTAQEYQRALEARTLRIPARMDERGNLYGSVSAADIERVLRERGHDIERRRIDLRKAIKQIGQYTVAVHLHPQVTAEIPIEIVDVEGEVTLEGLEAERREAAEEAATLEERALAAAEAVEAEEAAAEEAEAEEAEADEAAESAADVAAPATDEVAESAADVAAPATDEVAGDPEEDGGA
ncbi:MAG: 50S ribosomal protein L9 [Nitriliruptorales bacterium]